jgi:hypothetical protein
MPIQPNRSSLSSRRNPTSIRGHAAAIPQKKTNWILWTFLGIALVSTVAVVAWRLQFQEALRQNDEKIMAMLVSADQLILADREDEAEAIVSKGIGLIPGDTRCQAVIERINTKRGMILQRKSEVSQGALMAAEQIAKNDIAIAIDELGRIAADEKLTPEARKAALTRVAELKRGVCSLRLPSDWPLDAELTIDNVTKEVVKGVIDGIIPGMHTITITRYGFRDPPPMEVKFRGTDPLPLPAVAWKPRGAKIFVKSIPSGAAVWFRGKDTGKKTPCEVDDMDDGQIEFVLKHPKYAVTTLKGLVKERQPLSMTATLEPLDEPSP